MRYPAIRQAPLSGDGKRLMEAQGRALQDVIAWARTGPRWWFLSAAALMLDGLLLSAHALHFAGALLDPDRDWLRVFCSPVLWNGGQDGSLLELFGLLQLGTAAVLLVLLSVGAPAYRVFTAWGCVFLVMAADDFFRLHERTGRLLALERVDPGLTEAGAQELGGLVFWAGAAATLGVGLVMAHRESSPAARHSSWLLLGTLVPLGVVAVGYVLVGATWPQLLDGTGGVVAASVRVAVKLLTMSALLVQALRLTTARS